MKNSFIIIPALLFLILNGCPVFEPTEPVSGITVFYNNAEITGITVEKGEIKTLKAAVSPFSENVFIAWEISGAEAAALAPGSGAGAECSIKGIETGTAGVTVRAWRKLGDTPVEHTIPVTVIEPRVTDIVADIPPVIGVGEERVLTAALVPSWASGVTVEWSTEHHAIVQLTAAGTIQGVSAGQAIITVAAGGFSKSFTVEIKNPDAIGNLAIYQGTTNVTATSIEVGLYEEIELTARIEPAGVYTYFKWSSGNPQIVSANPLTGEIKGLTANGSATITVSASGLERQVTVTVKNPVTGIRIQYDNAESLPVINTIWLYPGEEVRLKAGLAPEGISAGISWAGANDEVTLSAQGEYCTLTGGNITRFDVLPTELRITAKNDSNGEKPVTAVIRVKTQAPPIWAWDRARDINSYAHNENLPTGNANLTLTGRGEGKYIEPIPLRVFGNPIPYTDFGLKINSSNANGGNPEPAGTPANSTRIMIGNNSGASTLNGHQQGVFNFLEIGGSIRISVDYEIIWTAGAGRNMWITVNNNQANATQSALNTNSQLLIQPLIDPRGTRVTAVTTLDVDDFVIRKVPGYETLDTAFIGIICLSNGGSIHVSGIRIEYGE